jgi:hypothetical protein
LSAKLGPIALASGAPDFRLTVAHRVAPAPNRCGKLACAGWHRMQATNMDIAQWLQRLGLEQYALAFAAERYRRKK